MESENAQYSRPKDATNTDSHIATVQNDVPMLFNTRVKKSKYSNSGMDNLTDNINLNQDSRVNLTLVTKMKIKLDYTTYQEPDRIVLNNNGNPTIDTRVGVTTGNESMTNRCKIQMTPTPNLQDSINCTIPTTMDPRASQHSGFDYSLTVKFKLY